MITSGHHGAPAYSRFVWFVISKFPSYILDEYKCMKIITDQRDVIRAILIFNLKVTSSVMCDQMNKDQLCCYLMLGS